MIADKIIRNFNERYTPEMLTFINELANEPSMKYVEFTVIDIDKTSDKFNQFIEGYANYRIKPSDNNIIPNNETIISEATKFINDDLFIESKIRYGIVSTYIESYLQYLQELTNKESYLTESMHVENVKPVDIGVLPTIVDIYSDCLVEKMNHIIDRLLITSGYNNYKSMSTIFNNKTKPIKSPLYFL